MNDPALQLAVATLAHQGKGDDAKVNRELGGRWLLAVADGLTHHSGGIAAREVIELLEKLEALPNDARALFEDLRAALPRAGTSPESRTTLTCGILSVEDRGGAPALVFDFFAIGDSPVWRVVRGPDGDRYPFQRYTLHGAPYPSETSKVYGTVRPHHPEPLQGTVSFGRAEVPAGDVLVICTDGIPERDVFVRDHAGPVERGGAAEYLCDWFFGARPYADMSLKKVLDGYARRNVLYDDATLIAARLAVAPPEVADEGDEEDGANESDEADADAETDEEKSTPETTPAPPATAEPELPRVSAPSKGTTSSAKHHRQMKQANNHGSNQRQPRKPTSGKGKGKKKRR